MPPGLARGPFLRSEALAEIGEKQLRGSSYTPLTRGVHMQAGPVTHTERIRAAWRILPAGSALAGRSALWAYGARLLGADAPVEVMVPAGSKVRSRAEITVRRDVLLPGEVVHLPLGWSTSPARTAFDVSRSGPAAQTVPYLDALAGRTGVTAAQALAVAAAHPGARWSSRVVPALGLMDAGAESVRESMLRVALMEAGLPRPVTQFVIRTVDGRFVARVDLAWPEFRVACEYDGAHHDERAQIVRDRARLNGVRECGWATVVVDAAQFAQIDRVVVMVRGVLVGAGWRG